jgi:hypothetical protein
MAAEPQVITTLVRMVVPMRREFGFSLDVHQFVHDQQYAATVLDKARASVDPKLREYAAHVQDQFFGPRAGVVPSARPAPPAPAPPQAPRPDAHATEEELRARMMKKYTTGLR